MQLLYWMERSKHDGWVFKSAAEWKQELCIPPRSQHRVRSNLKKYGLIEETYHRPSHKMFFRVVIPVFEKLMEDIRGAENAVESTGQNQENAEEAPAKMASGSGQNGESIYHRVQQKVQKKNPLTPCQQGAPSFSSPGTSECPSPFPANRDPKFPRAGGHEDWTEAVFMFDPENAAAVASLFPRCEQNWPPDLARKYVNLRRESPLSDKNLKLILARYRKASGLWEEAPNKERTWKARTLSEFLTAKHLDLACAMIRADLQDNLGQACDALRSWQEDEYRLNFLVCARDVLEADIKEGSSSLLGRARFNEDPTSFLIVGFNRPGAQDIRDQMREKIQMDLTEYTGVLKFCQNKKIDTKQLFGFSEEEIQGWHQAREKEYQETINDWKNLL